MAIPRTLIVKQALLQAILVLAIGMTPPPARAETIPGVPEGCCGYWNCRRAKTTLISLGQLRASVVVDGKTIEVRSKDVHWSNEGWYCTWGVRGGTVCQPPQVSSLCAVCVVIPEPAVVEFRNIPQVQVLPARDGQKLLIPVGRDCSKCHS